ncbi:MAG: exodeoxyribonuclease III [Gammaproteobacteria bacterium]|nr:exodeoxyribonuclease III [Gammaproteobacteria bacterium]MDH3412584.1 exodeoxyribonuclease III [Gammaproteobacteria bacterium]
MKIATWNVNSLKVRLPQVVNWIGAHKPDVLALQETKVTDENFPAVEINASGYEAAFSGQKTYNGVAMLTTTPVKDVDTNFPGLVTEERRTIAATVNGVRIVNLYVVNGQEVGSEKYAYKLKWLDAVADYLHAQVEKWGDVIVVGDFNIAPEDRDVHDPEAWREQILCSTPEREALQKILKLGFSDVFRKFEQDDKSFSWWDYRAAAFRRNMGLRIDLVLATERLRDVCIRCDIDKSPRKNERPSDHAPVVAEFEV